MRILIACEFSGVLRDEFLEKGHDAYSCDIMPSRGVNSDRHYCQDVRPLLNKSWDMIIAHPPCTYLTKTSGPALKADPTRLDKMHKGAIFFRLFFQSAPKVCVENPTPFLKAIELIGRKWDQKVCPSEFGSGHTKDTCLWLEGLPLLIPTKAKSTQQNTIGRSLPPSQMRGRLRSITDRHLARAMAAQWG